MFPVSSLSLVFICNLCRLLFTILFGKVCICIRMMPFSVRQSCRVTFPRLITRTCSLYKSAFLLLGKKSCAIWSSAGPVVKLGSSFEVFCTFNCSCKGSMYSEHPPTRQSHKVWNSTTISHNVVNITKNRTFSCHCSCASALDPCGQDISAGREYEIKEQESIHL